jgi:virginiamycin B lyase
MWVFQDTFTTRDYTHGQSRARIIGGESMKSLSSAFAAVVVAGVVAVLTPSPVKGSGSQAAHAGPELFRYSIVQFASGTRPGFLIRGADGDLYFAEEGKDSIGQFDPKTGRSRTYPAPRRFSPIVVMANGPDGEVWFSDGIGTIYSIATNGFITEYAMPHHRGIAGLTTGPDRDLWLTEGVDDRIARFDPRRDSFVEFVLPHPNSGPCKIVTGSDGAMWFTELGGGRIGRITLDGRITEYALPDRRAEPFMIVSGPDGALWFAEYNAGMIGRMATDGRLTEYRTSSPATEPMHLSFDSKDALWFTEVGGNALGRITPDGVRREFSLGERSNPDGITLDAAGRIWFTEWGANRLGLVASP